MKTNIDSSRIDSKSDTLSFIFRLKERQKQELEEAKMMDEIKRMED